MPSLSSITFGSLVGGLIFSGIGFVAFTYGKRTENYRIMAVGGVLMVYTFFVSGTALIYLMGLGLTGALLLFKD